MQLLVAFVGGGALLTLLALQGGKLGVLAGSLLVVLVCLPTIARLRRDVLDGPGIYAAASAVTLGVLSLVWLGSPSFGPPGIGVDEIADALVLLAAGLACFGIGARVVGSPHPRGALRVPTDRLPSTRVLVAPFAVGVVGAAVGLLTGAIGYSASSTPSQRTLAASQALTQLAGLGALVVLATALVYFGAGSREHRRVLLILAPLQVAVGFAMGFKGLSLAPIVLVGLAYVACRMRLPRRLIGAALIAVLLVVPAVTIYRAVLNQDARGGGATTGTVSRTAYYYVSARFRLIDHIALIKARTPSVYEYGGGSRYALLPLFVVVPRALWSDKPVLQDGLEFSHTYWEIPVAARTGTPITQIGDLYRNFAWPGVLLGLGAWGVVVAWFTRLCARWRSPRVEMLYLVSLLYWIPYVESDLPELIAAASKALPVTAAAAWLLLPGGDTAPGYRRLLDWTRRTTRRSPQPSV
jgi:hypothetical protein